METSDGYHTFKELYEFRLLYNVGFFNELYQNHNFGVHKSRLHSDGKAPFGKTNWFVVSAELPTGQITNHYEIEHWDLFKIEERTKAVEWDGHTSEDVAKRLRAYLSDMEQYAPLVNTDVANPPSTPTSTDSNNKLGERMERGVTTLTELIRHYKNSEVSERSVCEYVERIIDEESHLHAPNSYVGRTVKSIKRRLSL